MNAHPNCRLGSGRSIELGLTDSVELIEAHAIMNANSSKRRALVITASLVLVVLLGADASKSLRLLEEAQSQYETALQKAGTEYDSQVRARSKIT